MREDFNKALIVVVLIGTFLFARERNMISNEIERQENYEKEENENKTELNNLFNSCEKDLKNIDLKVNSFLDKFKKIEVKIINNYVKDSLTTYFFDAIIATKIDSSQREKEKNNFILNKLTKNNTLIVLKDQIKEQEKFNLSENFKETLKGNYIFQNKISFQTDLNAHFVKESLEKCKTIKYVLIAKEAVLYKPKIINKNNFESGIIGIYYEIYDLESSNKLHESYVYAENSENISTFNYNSTGQLNYNIIERDLKTNGKFELIKLYNTNK